MHLKKVFISIIDTIYDTIYNKYRSDAISKIDKLICKIKNNPTNVKFETLQKLLVYFGFEERQPSGGSSHYTYRYKDTIITIPKHKPVNKIYVKRVLEILFELNFEE